MNLEEYKNQAITAITEKEFRQQIVDLAKLMGYKVYFSWISIHSPAGFPDLVLANPEKKNKLIFAELKSGKGKVTELQWEWIDTLRACGQDVYILYPYDLEWFIDILKEGK